VAFPPALAAIGRSLIGLDIETDTTVNGLDPDHSGVIAAALATDREVRTFSGPEPELLRALDHALAELEPGVIVTWNGTAFDLPFLATRAERVGVAIGLRIDGASASWGAHCHLDVYTVYAADVRRAVGISCSLKSVARFVGIPAIEVDAAQLHRLDDSTVRAYVASDASAARALAIRRWPAAAAWVAPMPAPPVDQAAMSAVAELLPASSTRR
jgi:DNA polymerase elongation subunit (family B)